MLIRTGTDTIEPLVARLYEPNRGVISANGTPIDRFDVDEWRSRVAIVRQNPYVFNDTLRYNVTVGNRESTDQDVRRVCEIARVDEFVDQLPDGYDTMLGDGGVHRLVPAD